MADPSIEQSINELETTKDEEPSVDEELRARTTETQVQAVMAGQLKSPAEVDAAINYDWPRLQINEIDEDPREQVGWWLFLSG